MDLSRPGFLTATPASDTETLDLVRAVLSSQGQSLDRSVQAEMEQRLGERFTDVQIHTGPQAAKACDDVNARAFTVGNHVVFNHGEYDPESPAGRYILTHELVHVRQQSNSHLIGPTEETDFEIGDTDSRYEREADTVAEQMLSPESTTTEPRVSPIPDATVQRMPLKERRAAVENSSREFRQLFYANAGAIGEILLKQLDEEEIAELAKQSSIDWEAIKSGLEKAGEVGKELLKHLDSQDLTQVFTDSSIDWDQVGDRLNDLNTSDEIDTQMLKRLTADDVKQLFAGESIDWEKVSPAKGPQFDEYLDDETIAKLNQFNTADADGLRDTVLTAFQEGKTYSVGPMDATDVSTIASSLRTVEKHHREHEIDGFEGTINAISNIDNWVKNKGDLFEIESAAEQINKGEEVSVIGEDVDILNSDKVNIENLTEEINKNMPDGYQVRKAKVKRLLDVGSKTDLDVVTGDGVYIEAKNHAESSDLRLDRHILPKYIRYKALKMYGSSSEVNIPGDLSATDLGPMKLKVKNFKSITEDLKALHETANDFKIIAPNKEKQ